jgi:hypothetical protein
LSISERDENAGERAAQRALRALAIEGVGLLEHARIHRDDGLELILVERDPRQVCDDQLARRQAPVRQRLAQLGDAGLDDGEGLLARHGRGAARRHEHGEGDQGEGGSAHGNPPLGRA